MSLAERLNGIAAPRSGVRCKRVLGEFIRDREGGRRGNGLVILCRSMREDRGGQSEQRGDGSEAKGHVCVLLWGLVSGLGRDGVVTRRVLRSLVATGAWGLEECDS